MAIKYVFRGGFMVPVDECDQGSCGCNNCEARPIQSSNVAYDGPNLPWTGIRTCENLTEAIKKIDIEIGKLIMALYNLTSTTTTAIP